MGSESEGSEDGEEDESEEGEVSEWDEEGSESPPPSEEKLHVAMIESSLALPPPAAGSVVPAVHGGAVEHPWLLAGQFQRQAETPLTPHHRL